LAADANAAPAAPASAGVSLSRCPRCGGEFHCGIDDPEPCACTSVRVSGETLRALRARYDGCLCVACLRALSAQAAQ